MEETEPEASGHDMDVYHYGKEDLLRHVVDEDDNNKTIALQPQVCLPQ